MPPRNMEPPALRAYANDPTDEMLRQKLFYLMEQAIYSTQEYQMKRMERMAGAYAQHTHYRMAFIFLKLDQMKHEMHTMWTYLYKNINWDDYKWWAFFVHQDHFFNMKLHLDYYSYFLRKNVDITYAIEYLRALFKEKNPGEGDPRAKKIKSIISNSFKIKTKH